MAKIRPTTVGARSTGPWTVYYDLSHDPVGRLHAAALTAGIPVQVLLPWCLTQCLDGLLHYIEVGDPRVPWMTSVMRRLGGVRDKGVTGLATAQTVAGGISAWGLCGSPG
jgi:hypothetical protein